MGVPITVTRSPIAYSLLVVLCHRSERDLLDRGVQVITREICLSLDKVNHSYVVLLVGRRGAG